MSGFWPSRRTLGGTSIVGVVQARLRLRRPCVNNPTSFECAQHVTMVSAVFAGSSGILRVRRIPPDTNRSLNGLVTGNNDNNNNKDHMGNPSLRPVQGLLVLLQPSLRLGSCLGTGAKLDLSLVLLEPNPKPYKSCTSAVKRFTLSSFLGEARPP